MKIVPALVIFVICGGLWLIDPPSGLDLKAWQLFIIFFGTILGVVLKPLPMGAIALLGVVFATLTQTLTLPQALSSFSKPVVWLVVFAFFIAKGFIKTGLGSRIAYFFISLLGKSSLGLSYGIVLTDFLLSPVIPSNTARSGGILFPIVKSLSEEYGSSPKEGTQRKIGAFLMQVTFQADVVISGIFLTALAGNPLTIGFAREFGAEITWMTWVLATIVPGMVCLLLIPLILYYLYPPEVKTTPEAPNIARENLKEMGSLQFGEVVMLLTFSVLLVLWIFGSSLDVHPATAALLGVVTLLSTGVLSWEDILKERGAWDTLIWFSILLGMATYLAEFGMMKWFGAHVQSLVSTYTMGVAVVILALIYFYSHYFFASATAHISSLYSVFLVAFIAAGVPPLPAALLLAVFSSLSSGLTHYGTGPAPVFYGAKYVKIKTWWALGAIISVVNLAVWALLGPVWWRMIGML
ncbi:MAG: DASS family sodium-coupled anion symporter [Alphaproteobacteria bacterium]|nr:DASS family sodium-coupled anion symporter [Alphaproteobacteria bacterium]MBT5389333.1 DASS family sodium-coupled anion symporter [Alphaproteobacteria bacterium]